MAFPNEERYTAFEGRARNSNNVMRLPSSLEASFSSVDVVGGAGVEVKTSTGVSGFAGEKT